MAHVLIVGAGPIGLEAALLASERGDTVTVVESGRRVGAGVRAWGHVTMFSTWEMNVSEAGRRALAELGLDPPDPNECPTGDEYCEQYLEPLAELLQERVDLRLNTDVVAIGRGHVLKSEHVGDGGRDGVQFRVFIDSAESEAILEADVVLDCSGVLDTPNFVGVGGIPALGEADLDDRIRRGVPDATSDEIEDFEGKRVMVLGSGMSAATTLAALLEVRQSAPATSVVWVRRGEGAPYERVVDDPLPGRDRLAAFGNDLASGAQGVEAIAGMSIRSIRSVQNGRLSIELEARDGRRQVEVVDELVANVGYRPSNALFEELQVHQCYASQGPMKLAASLAAADGRDCLAQPTMDADLLGNPEPDFFVLGTKSYGRNPQFLLRTGFEQVAQVIGRLERPRSAPVASKL